MTYWHARCKGYHKEGECPLEKGKGMGPIEYAGMERYATPASHYEAVNHPPHYNSNPSGIECITVVRHMTFNVGNAVKYCWRAGFKPGAETIEELRKACWYLEDEIKRLGGKL